MAHDRTTDTVFVYDALLFDAQENEPVIADSFHVRGQWVPIAWSASAEKLTDELRKRRCRMLPNGIKESLHEAGIITRDIDQRINTGRFIVADRLGSYAREIKNYRSHAGQALQEGVPLMTATRYAMANLRAARTENPRKAKNKKLYYPKVNVR